MFRETTAPGDLSLYHPIRLNLRLTGISNRLGIVIASERELIIVWALAFAVYLPAIWWGVPHATHPLGVHSWEIDAVTGMQTLSELHNLLIEAKPDWYLAYPLFHYLVLGALYAPYFLFLYVTGGMSQPTASYPFGFADPVEALKHLTLIGRALTVLMAAGVVVNAYLAAKAVWDKQTARLTAIAAALPTTMVFYARTGNLEVPMLFWMSAAILVLARSLTSGLTVGRAVCLGIFASLAVATKDAAYGALLIGLVLLVLIHIRRGTPRTERSDWWKAPAALLLSCCVVFAFASGLAIFPQRFAGHLQFVNNFEKTFFNVVHLDLLRPKTLAGYVTLIGDAGLQLVYALGPVLLITGLFGLAVTWRTTMFTKVLSLMMIGHIILVILPVRHMQYRYIVFPVFAFAFLVARALALGLRQKRQWLAVSTLTAAIIGFGWVGARAIDLTYQMMFDARYDAGDWLAAHVEPGDKIGFFTDQNCLPRLPAQVVPVKLLLDSSTGNLRRERSRFVLIQQDYSTAPGSDHSRFLQESVYKEIVDGDLGYRKAASFNTLGVFPERTVSASLAGAGRVVNPSVVIYELDAGSVEAY